MPAKSSKQYGAAQAALHGDSSIMPESVAKEMVKKTPKKKRTQFAKALAKRR